MSIGRSGSAGWRVSGGAKGGPDMPRPNLLLPLLALTLLMPALPLACGGGGGGGGDGNGNGFDHGWHFLAEPPRNPSLGISEPDNPGQRILLHSGECRLTRTDLAIRGRRMGFTFQRTYRSGAPTDGPLGFGWDANVLARLEALPNGTLRHHRGAFGLILGAQSSQFIGNVLYEWAVVADKHHQQGRRVTEVAE